MEERYNHRKDTKYIIGSLLPMYKFTGYLTFHTPTPEHDNDKLKLLIYSGIGAEIGKAVVTYT